MTKPTRLCGKALFLGLIVCLAGLIPSPLGAQSLDLRVGRYTDMNEFFVGAGLLSAISSHFTFNPNVEYVTVSNATYLTFNFDFHRDFYTTSPLFFWLGAGLGILYFNPKGAGESNTDLGANLLFGLGIRTQSSLIPYVQAKFILADNDEFVIGVGLRF
jgi:hypothetical protein